MAWTRKSIEPQADCTAANTASMVAGIGHVAIADHDAADLLGQRLDALFQRVALIGESQLGAVAAAGLGDAPGERAMVGDPHDQAALAAHEARDFRHVS